MSDAVPTPPSDPAGAPPARSKLTGDQVKDAFSAAHPLDLGLVAAGVLVFLLSFLPYYKGTVETSGSIPGAGSDLFGAESGSWNAWHGFFGWFAALVALAVAGVLVARMLGVRLDGRQVRLASLIGFGVATACVLMALLVNPLPGEESKDTFGGVTIEYSKGHGVGFWLTLIVVVAGLVLAFRRKDAVD